MNPLKFTFETPSFAITTFKFSQNIFTESLDKVTQKYIKPSLQFQHKQLCKDYKDAKTMDDAETKYYVIRS